MFKVRKRATAPAAQAVASPVRRPIRSDSHAVAAALGQADASVHKALTAIEPIDTLLSARAQALKKTRPAKTNNTSTPRGLAPGILASLQQQSHYKRPCSEVIVPEAREEESRRKSPSLGSRSSGFGVSIVEEFAGSIDIPVSDAPLASTTVGDSQQRRRYMVQVKIEEALIRHPLKVNKSPADYGKLSTQIEHALHNALGSDKTAYTNQARSIIFNLNDAQNTDFRSLLAVGFIRPDDTPHLSPEEMASYERSVRRARDRKTSKEEIQTDWDMKHGPVHVEGVLLCDSCSGAQTTYFQLQTRCCDEPLTTFAMCFTCNARWKC